uniref:Uncharacterized protein n=1 Tax=Triticum urartu TaxID=4572 RepID=A0A8R7JVM5_TRIUA
VVDVVLGRSSLCNIYCSFIGVSFITKRTDSGRQPPPKAPGPPWTEEGQQQTEATIVLSRTWISFGGIRCCQTTGLEQRKLTWCSTFRWSL